MLAPASLVLVTMLLSAPPARAGHWRYSAAGSTASATVITGIVTPGTPAPSPWLPPADADDALTLTLPGVSVQDTNDTPGQTPSCSCKAIASIQIKATWTHEDPNTQNDTNDPPPTSVWVVETSSATWSGLPGRSDTGPGGGGGAAVSGGGAGPAGAPGSPAFNFSGAANDGLGDPDVELPVGGPPGSGSSISHAPQPPMPLPPGWSKCKVTGDQIVFTGMPRGLSANGTAAGTTPGMCSVQCSLGPYSITVHPQPYNFTQATPTTGSDGTGHTNGVYITKYTWSSTDGHLSNLSSCTEYEFVTYPGTQGTVTSPTAFLPPNPPFNSSWDYDTSNPPQPRFPNPTENGGNASYGFSTDTVAIYGFSPPYTTGGGFTGTQNFYFDDCQTGEKMVPMPGNVPMPISIVRTVGTLGANYTPYWWYTVTKTSPASNPVVKYPLPGQ